ncbi:hypothetical protein L2E82_08330 [Cichorium intybus]|uniref:Uncharacterized protein n=1 Tax=Cichorium intybus TaxID=13427 RepID=A0ACB9G7A9_CICIN|nr:hypothetical protein L2E82_08330 [Cichorium intybus]
MTTTNIDPEGVYAVVELNYQGVFRRCPFSYEDGMKFTFTEHDWASMNYAECVTFLEKFMHENCKKLYYCEPDEPMYKGLRPISNDVEYASFIFITFGTLGKISLFVDHIGDELEDWVDFDKEGEEHDSCIEGRENGDDT